MFDTTANAALFTSDGRIVWTRRKAGGSHSPGQGLDWKQGAMPRRFRWAQLRGSEIFVANDSPDPSLRLSERHQDSTSTRADTFSTFQTLSRRLEVPELREASGVRWLQHRFCVAGKPCFISPSRVDSIRSRPRSRVLFTRPPIRTSVVFPPPFLPSGVDASREFPVLF